MPPIDRVGCQLENCGDGGPSRSEAGLRYRLWIVNCREWRPTSWSSLPPRATAVEPATGGVCSALDARLFIEGFNSQMLLDGGRLWMVAVPVRLRFEGDLQPGCTVSASTCAAALGCKPGLDPASLVE